MHLRNLVVGSLATVALLAPGRIEAQSQTGGTVRIGSPTAKVMSRRHAGGEVVLTAHEGDTFELLNREESWYWVVLPVDIHGGRAAGWIQGTDIEGSEYRAAAEQRALEEAQAKAAKELQKIERERAKADAEEARRQAKAAAEEARQLKLTQQAAAKDAAERAEEGRRLQDAAEQLEKARREYENSIKGAAPTTSQSVPQESIAMRSVAAADFGESVLP